MATNAKTPARLTNEQLGRRLRAGLKGAKRMVQEDAAHRRSASVVLAYLAGYLDEDMEVAAVLVAASKLDFDKEALSAATANSPVHA